MAKAISSTFFILIAFLFTTCSEKKESWPIVKLPEGADTTTAIWKGIDLEPRPPVVPVSPKEQRKTFLLQDGYEIEPVLTEPQIQQPAAVTFDGNGRMYVLELRSYMLTADSKGTLEPVSGISRWEDADNDGSYETGGMFVDGLVFPRFVLAIGPNSILTMESNADVVYKYTDTNNDGKADKKEFFTDNFGRAGNVEHQQAFLYWGMDNWLYSTVNPFRVRETSAGVIRESTGSNHAQWGVTHDDDGKLWFQGGASGVPSYFQFPIHYGDYVVEKNFAPGFEEPWGAPIGIADMQGGMQSVRMPDGSLNRVTGSSGNDVYRGDRLPKEIYGEYFYGEPVARIVRRIRSENSNGLTILHNFYQAQRSEFIRSSDPLFRPVDMATAPDGTMYIVDMYHGIIQEGEWTPVGSYLRVKIEQYQLDKVVNLGRIWRLSHKNTKRDLQQPRMYDASSTQLVKYLSHPNGWWRDMAQQVLVQRGDSTIVDDLVQVVQNPDNLLARFHALWVLEGIDKLDPLLVRSLLSDGEPRMRIMAMWVSESLYKKGDASFAKDYLRLIDDPDRNVKMRAMMTCRLFKIPGTEQRVKKILASDTTAGVQLVGKQVLNPPVVNAYFGRTYPNLSEDERKMVEAGAKIYEGLCATCHGTSGAGTPASKGKLMAPSLVNSPRIQAHPDYVVKVLLRGMTGDIEHVSYAGGMMAPMGANSDEWIASVASFIRMNFENESSMIRKEEVARVRRETAGQATPYTYSQLWTSIPKALQFDSDWKVSSSHIGQVRKGSTGVASAAFTFEGWTTGITQQQGMWFQIELPSATTLAEIQFRSPAISRGWRPGSPPPIPTYPRGYTVQVSMDGKVWTTALNDAAGNSDFTVIRLSPVTAKFVKITLTKSETIVHGERNGKPFDYEVPWNIRELRLFALTTPPQ